MCDQKKKPREAISELAELLGRSGPAATAYDLLQAIGALERRREHVEQEPDLAAELSRLLDLARPRLAAAAVDQALESLPLEELESRFRELLDSATAAEATLEGGELLDLLRHRELAETVVWGARRAAAGEAPLSPTAPLEGALDRSLERIDRLGRATVSSFLVCNTARRAAAGELDPTAAEASWWWTLRADCDPFGLVQLLDGALDGAPDGAPDGARREATLEHLRSCAGCQEDARWIGQVEGLLGPVTEGHISSAELTAFAAGELPAPRREAIAAHLVECEGCRQLQWAAADGLEEAEKVERSLAVLEATGLEATGLEATGLEDEVVAVVHLPFAIAPAPQARALAADAAVAAAAPLPRDRRILLEEAGVFRLVYYHLGGQGRAGLFCEEVDGVNLEAELDGEPLVPVTDPEGVLTLELGPARRLPGKTLLVTLGMAGAERRLSWTFVEDPG